MTMKGRIAAGPLALLLASTSGAAPPPPPAPAMPTVLRAVQPGRWAIEPRASGEGKAQTLCLRDGGPLVQLRHPGSACRRYVITDTRGDATVHYTCAGTGHGRTTVRPQGSRTLQIETQGVAGGLPFDDALVARRIGACVARR